MELKLFNHLKKNNMSKIVVAKLVRLGQNGDRFDQNMIAQVMRTNAKIDSDYIVKFNETWATRGQMYIIDETATKERDSLLSKSTAKDEEKAIRAALFLEAKSIGLSPAKTIKTEDLQNLINENQSI